MSPKPAPHFRLKALLKAWPSRSSFLCFRTLGFAYRRRELGGVNGDEIKVTFLRQEVRRGRRKRMLSRWVPYCRFFLLGPGLEPCSELLETQPRYHDMEKRVATRHR